MKLALGTVQFGMPYGIANDIGQVPASEVVRIVEAAAAAGMDTLDTAIGYGESEAVLGQINLSRWKIVTKLPGVPEAVAAPDWVRSCVEQSCSRLNVSRLYAIMLHHPSDLDGPHGPAIYRALADLKAERLVDRIGFSIYGPIELDTYFRRFPPDIVQAPLNVFDQRLITSGWLERLAETCVEVHTRSAFLQGLLLMETAARPAKFDRWQRQFQSWDRWVKQWGKGRLSAALGFPWSQNAVHRVVVGVNGLAQLQDIIQAAAEPCYGAAKMLATEDEELVNPSLWDKL